MHSSAIRSFPEYIVTPTQKRVMESLLISPIDMPKNLIPKLKLWLRSDSSQDSFGDGKWRLLEAINKTDNLKAACDQLGISYRKAWGDLKKAEKCLDFALATKSRGGHEHGQSQLTEKGKAWIKAYAKYHRDVQKASKSAYHKYLEEFE